MYSNNTLQLNILVNYVLLFIEQEKVHNIEAAIQLVVASLTNEYRKLFYISYSRHDEDRRIPHNHRKVPTVYCDPRF